MDKDTIQKAMYGAISELLEDTRYYYFSEVAQQYCELTTKGQQAVVDLVEEFAYNIVQAKRAEDIERSKKIVLDELKGTNDQNHI